MPLRSKELHQVDELKFLKFFKIFNLQKQKITVPFFITPQEEENFF